MNKMRVDDGNAFHPVSKLPGVDTAPDPVSLKVKKLEPPPLMIPTIKLIIDPSPSAKPAALPEEKAVPTPTTPIALLEEEVTPTPTTPTALLKKELTLTPITPTTPIEEEAIFIEDSPLASPASIIEEEAIFIEDSPPPSPASVIEEEPVPAAPREEEPATASVREEELAPTTPAIEEEAVEAIDEPQDDTALIDSLKLDDLTAATIDERSLLTAKLKLDIRKQRARRRLEILKMITEDPLTVGENFGFSKPIQTIAGFVEQTLKIIDAKENRVLLAKHPLAFTQSDDIAYNMTALSDIATIGSIITLICQKSVIKGLKKTLKSMYKVQEQILTGNTSLQDKWIHTTTQQENVKQIIADLKRRRVTIDNINKALGTPVSLDSPEDFRQPEVQNAIKQILIANLHETITAHEQHLLIEEKLYHEQRSVVSIMSASSTIMTANDLLQKTSLLSGAMRNVAGGITGGSLAILTLTMTLYEAHILRKKQRRLKHYKDDVEMGGFLVTRIIPQTQAVIANFCNKVSPDTSLVKDSPGRADFIDHMFRTFDVRINLDTINTTLRKQKHAIISTAEDLNRPEVKEAIASAIPSLTFSKTQIKILFNHFYSTLLRDIDHLTHPTNPGRSLEEICKDLEEQRFDLTLNDKMIAHLKRSKNPRLQRAVSLFENREDKNMNFLQFLAQCNEEDFPKIMVADSLQAFLRDSMVRKFFLKQYRVTAPQREQTELIFSKHIARQRAFEKQMQSKYQEPLQKSLINFLDDKDETLALEANTEIKAEFIEYMRNTFGVTIDLDLINERLQARTETKITTLGDLRSISVQKEILSMIAKHRQGLKVSVKNAFRTLVRKKIDITQDFLTLLKKKIALLTAVSVVGIALVAIKVFGVAAALGLTALMPWAALGLTLLGTAVIVWGVYALCKKKPHVMKSLFQSGLILKIQNLRLAKKEIQLKQAQKKELETIISHEYRNLQLSTHLHDLRELRKISSSESLTDEQKALIVTLNLQGEDDSVNMQKLKTEIARLEALQKSRQQEYLAKLHNIQQEKEEAEQKFQELSQKVEKIQRRIRAATWDDYMNLLKSQHGDMPTSVIKARTSSLIKGILRQRNMAQAREMLDRVQIDIDQVNEQLKKRSKEREQAPITTIADFKRPEVQHFIQMQIYHNFHAHKKGVQQYFEGDLLKYCHYFAKGKIPIKKAQQILKKQFGLDLTKSNITIHEFKDFDNEEVQEAITALAKENFSKLHLDSQILFEMLPETLVEMISNDELDDDMRHFLEKHLMIDISSLQELDSFTLLNEVKKYFAKSEDQFLFTLASKEIAQKPSRMRVK